MSRIFGRGYDGTIRRMAIRAVAGNHTSMMPYTCAWTAQAEMSMSITTVTSGAMARLTRSPLEAAASSSAAFAGARGYHRTTAQPDRSYILPEEAHPVMMDPTQWR